MRSLALLLCIISVVNGFTDTLLFCRNNAAKTEYPYLVRIMYSNNLLCGGTIINNHYILTSADCVYNQESADLEVVAGTNSLYKGSVKYFIREVHWHPKYNKTRISYNIGLIRVFDDIKFNSIIQPITLSSSVNVPVAKEVKHVGWQMAEFVFGEMQETIMEKEVCNKHTGSTDLYKICTYTGTNGKSLCASGLGNPLIMNSIQIGIVNEETLCSSNSIMVYTMVALHIPWIQEIAGEITVSAGNQVDLNIWIVLSHAILMLLSYSYSRL